MKKSQAEIIIIAGVFLLAVVIVYYAVSGGFRATNIPESVYQKQKSVQQSFIDMVRAGSYKTLRVMETHGGYPTIELLGNGTYEIPEFVVFAGEGIPYWVKCQHNLSPSKNEVKKWFEASVENYIKTHIKEVSDKYKNVSFDISKLSVSANILSNPTKVEITVNLPTKVDGYSIQNPLYPYKTSLETKFGEILDFAADLSKAQSSKRFLEIFTIASIYMSKDDKDGHPKLPTGGFMTNCGETIYRTPEKISAYLKEIAEYVVTQVLWWQDMPVDLAKPKVYAINKEIIGKEYRDLDIKMYLPDDFEFETKSPIVITNTKRAYTSMFWTAYDCLGVYSMSYSVSYPVIVRVKDPLSGYFFNFAVLVFVDNEGNKMSPGKCENIGAGAEICKDLNCYAKIKVVDEFGNPLKGAVATFGDCVIGTSDSSGYIEGKIKCGNYELNIYLNSSYDYYNKNVSSSEINKTYVLSSISNFTAHFRKVEITEYGTDAYGEPISCRPCQYGSSCVDSLNAIKCVIDNANDHVLVDLYSKDYPERMFTLTNIDPESIPDDCIDKMNSCVEQCQSSLNINQCSQCASQCLGNVLDSININYIPSGNYYVNATSLSVNMMKETGGFLSDYNLKSSSKDIYFNIPEAASPDYKLSENKKLCLAQKLRECNIEPVSDTAYPKTTLVTSCTCGNLLSALTDVGCPVSSMFCTCPSGSSYPSGCGQYCDNDYVPCDTCCPLNTVLKFALDNCNTRVICK
ncbi:MAG: hypothetical protein QXN71_00850 [Candidatus Aenigmatarchaeota archaeon]